ncbi:YdeI/OmpD-associated family protein [Catalinimonas niigatensis]|uniref:YdeI/OmpD-associated family protein n=1 Tax=Catalinimonas niigatensis TaxID=1397264 RepID=UPI0026652BE8|nr:YdeI/OmpD-associated family protein [Catalinimonas niigatensis]WPP52938.1 YdeI/OmpD-associated family protein [Catalinimonas niigatensis]
MELKEGIKTFHASTRQAWRQWLEENHATEKSVWLIIYKKESGVPSVYYPEAVEEALCFGWIDSKANKRDAQSYYLYFAQRKPKSKWSKVNKVKVEKLLQQGLMAPAGLETIELAQRNGSWTALDEVEKLMVPDDLQLAFDKNKMAYENWQKFPPSTRRGILEWILNAKRPETRQKRIEETLAQAARNIRANQYRQ